MNYEKIYSQIIEKAKNRVLDSYKERHHIIPRCIGGNDNKENLVDLTAREHFICHKLLVEMYPDNNSIKYAFFMMSNRYKQYSLSSRHYTQIKETIKDMVSDQTKKKLSELKKAWWNSKVDRSYETLYGTDRAIALKELHAHQAKNISAETRKKIGDASRKRIYKPMSEETKQKIREKRKLQDMSHLRGKPRSEEVKRKISNTKKLINKK